MKSNQNNLLTRRNFVKSTTLATTGLLSASIPVGAMANVNGDKKLKIALVGMWRTRNRSNSSSFTS